MSLWLVWLLTITVNPDLTPGRTRALSVEQICSTKWGVDRRVVTDAMKRHVAAAYGVPWAERTAYEFDHLVPRSLGGADDILNLWPQPWAAAKQKDRLEVTLGKLVCAGKLTLGEAQRVIRTDWRGAYRRYVGPLVDEQP